MKLNLIMKYNKNLMLMLPKNNTITSSVNDACEGATSCTSFY
jgi:hypothetical protein